MDQALRSIFGDRGAQAHLIKAGRLQRAMTQRELARRLGVHPQTVAHLESGRRLATSEQLVGKLAEVLGYTPDQIHAAAHRIAPDMRAYIEASPKLQEQIRVLMNRQQQAS